MNNYRVANFSGLHIHRFREVAVDHVGPHVNLETEGLELPALTSIDDSGPRNVARSVVPPLNLN